MSVVVRCYECGRVAKALADEIERARAAYDSACKRAVSESRRADELEARLLDLEELQ